MLKHFITTIDYTKLIEMQSKECKTRLEKTNSVKAVKTSPKIKRLKNNRITYPTKYE